MCPPWRCYSRMAAPLYVCAMKLQHCALLFHRAPYLAGPGEASSQPEAARGVRGGTQGRGWAIGASIQRPHLLIGGRLHSHIAPFTTH